jgi:hypothetical protein
VRMTVDTRFCQGQGRCAAPFSDALSRSISFVSVTQQFNTTTSMGRSTLNVLLSFAQLEREVTSERIRDKIAASKPKGLWVGGPLPLGYPSDRGKRFTRALVPVPNNAPRGTERCNARGARCLR